MDAREYFERGIEFFNQGDCDRAIADFTESLRLEPTKEIIKNNLCAAYFNRGVGSFQKGDGNRAIADLNEAIALNPNDADVYGSRGTINDKMGNHDEVIKDFTEVIRIAPTAAAYLFRSKAYSAKCKEALSKGDRDGFFKYRNLEIKDLEASLQIDPSDENVRKMLELAISEQERRKQVFDYLG
jgi:tetratricopeptide (TPR) repeat protein